MKNNIVKRLLAGTLALAVGGAGFTGVCVEKRYDLGEVKAADQDTDKTEDKDITKLEETAGEVLESDEKREEKKSGDTSKEESVYIKADPSGNVTETTVTEWLKNPGSGSVEDESELSDIKNGKGE